MNLKKIKGIGEATAENLKKEGINTVQKLANSRLEDLLKIKGIGRSTAQKYIDEAKNLLEFGELAIEIERPKKVQKFNQRRRKELKELIKSQAECNVGLVGHVDHGTSWKFLLLPQKPH